MNKGISLAIVAVLLCAMGIIFFMNINASNDETNLASAPLEEIQPTSTPEAPASSGSLGTPQNGSASSPSETPQGLPLVADKKVGQTQPASPKTESVKPAPTKKEAPVSKPAETKPAPAQSAQSTPKAGTTAQTSPPSLTPLETPIQKPTTAATAQTTASQEPADGHTLSKIGLHFKGNDIYLRIEANTAFKTKIFALTEPDRLVVDLVGKWHNVTPPTIPSNQLVTKARIGSQPNATRLVLDLSRGTKYTIDKPSDSVVEILMQ